jgi:hypothetical protein
LRKSVGIAANVGSITKDYFDQNQVPKRLLALACIFKEQYTQMCDATFGKDNGCHAFARSNAGIYDYVTARRLEKHLETMCTERVFNDKVHIFRTQAPTMRGVIGSSGGSLSRGRISDNSDETTK